MSGAGKRVVIIGAGLVGACAAIALRKRGLGAVLLERAVPGAEASAAAGGILSPQAECDRDDAFFALCLAGLQATRALAEELRTAVGVDVELDMGGTLLTAGDANAARALVERVAWQQQRGLDALWISKPKTAYFPREGRLDPKHYTVGALQYARALGAEVVSDRRVEQIAVAGGRACGVQLADGSLVAGDAVLLAAGAWSSQVKGGGVSADDVFPVRGQMIEVSGTLGALDCTVFVDHAYAIPRRDGRVVLGSTMERVGFDKRTTPEGLARVRAAIDPVLPALRDAPVLASWAGLRPGTPDGLPLLGEGATPGLFVSTGHFRNGVLLAALSGELLAATVAGEKTVIDLAPFSPRRFSRTPAAL